MSLNSDMLTLADTAWKALADPTRRRIIETLARREATTGELVESFAPGLVRTAVMKHLDVLEGARLIRVERVGRQRINRIERGPLKEISQWLNRHIQNHQSNLSRLKSVAESNHRKTKQS